MSLSISKKHLKYELKGSINTSTVNSFKSHMISMLDCEEQLVIDIESVNLIDHDGMQAFRELYKTAQKQYKPVFVVGYGCKEVMDDLREYQNAV